MNEITIQEKLILIREGYSLESINEYINEAAKDTGDIFLESVISDINYMTETTLEYLTENDNEEAKKNRFKKMLDWLIAKVNQFIALIKEKFNIIKEKIIKKKNETKFEDATPNGATFIMYDKVFEGTDKLNEVIDGLLHLFLSPDPTVAEGKTVDTLYPELFKSILKNYSGNTEIVRDVVIGKMERYEFNDKSYVDKMIKIVEDIPKLQDKIQKIGDMLKSSLAHIRTTDYGNDSVDMLTYFTALLTIAVHIRQCIAIHADATIFAMDKLTGKSK
jgi:hypothetical protein